MEVQFVSPELLWEVVQQGDKVKDFCACQRDQIIEDLLAQPLLAARQAARVVCNSLWEILAT